MSVYSVQPMQSDIGGKAFYFVKQGVVNDEDDNPLDLFGNP